MCLAVALLGFILFGAERPCCNTSGVLMGGTSFFPPWGKTCFGGALFPNRAVCQVWYGVSCFGGVPARRSGLAWAGLQVNAVAGLWS